MVQVLTPPGGIENLCPPGLKQSASHGYGEAPTTLRGKILRNAPSLVNKTPLYALTSAMKKQTALRATEVSWFEKKYDKRKLTICGEYDDAGGVSGTPQVIQVKGSPWTIKENQQLKNFVTGEIMLIACAPVGVSASEDQLINLQVIRGYAGTTPREFTAPAEAGCGMSDCLVKMGSAFEEKSCNPSPIRRDPTPRSNQTQIFRDGYCITGTAKEIDYVTGNPLDEMKADALHEHSSDIERSMLFGVMHTSQRNGKLVRTMDGIETMIKRYAPDNYIIRDPNAAMGFNELEDYLNFLFVFGSETRVAFAGRNAAINLERMIRANTKFQMTMATLNGGMRVMKIRGVFGTIAIKVHPDFHFMGEPWDSSLMILDMANIGYHAVRNRDTKHYDFSSLAAKSNGCGKTGQDGDDFGFLTECTISMGNPENSMIIQNICEVGEDCYECVVPAPHTTCSLPKPKLPCPPARVDCDRVAPVACQGCGCPTKVGECGDCAEVAAVNELPDQEGCGATTGIQFEEPGEGEGEGEGEGPGPGEGPPRPDPKVEVPGVLILGGKEGKGEGEGEGKSPPLPSDPIDDLI